MTSIDFERELQSFQNKDVNILNICNDDKNIWLYHHLIKNNVNSHLYIFSDSKESHHEFKKDRQISFLDSNKLHLLLQANYSNQNYKSLFDIILIQPKCFKDPTSELITLFQLLHENGKIILLHFSKEEYSIIKSFIHIYSHYTQVKQYFNMICINKKNIENSMMNIDIPYYVQSILNNFDKESLFNLKLNAKHEMIKKIYWDFELNNFYDQGENIYGYDNKIEKYNKNIYSIELLNKYDMQNFLDVLSINSYFHKKLNNKNIILFKKHISKYIEYKIKKKHIDLFLNSSFILKNKKFNIFIITNLKDKTLLTKEFKYFGITQYTNIIYSLKKNKNYLNTFNLFNFNLINNYVKSYKIKYDIFFININKYFKKFDIYQSYIFYKEYIFVHLLYMILSIQKIGGELYFVTTPLVDQVQIQFLQILSSFYKKISLKISQTFKHQYFNVVIHATDFQGISKEELKEFETKYQVFYDVHVASHIQEMFEGKKVKDLHLKSIFSNPISKNLQKSVYDFNTEYYKLFIPGVQNKLDLHEFLTSKSTSKKQKEYVKNEIFKMQYQYFVKTYKEIEKDLKK